MDKELIRKKVLKEKKGNLISIIEFNNKKYIKVLHTDMNDNIEYKYYEILEDRIEEIDDETSNDLRDFYEVNYNGIDY